MLVQLIQNLTKFLSRMTTNDNIDDMTDENSREQSDDEDVSEPENRTILDTEKAIYSHLH